MSRVLVWFSCGAASSVAAHLALQEFDNVEILYCNTIQYEHPDNIRYFEDVQEWLGQEIKILESQKYSDIYDVFYKTKYLKGPAGARCTLELKRNVRKAYQKPDDLHIFGLTYDEGKRIARFERDNPSLDLEWILYDNKITKKDCYRIIQDAGIEIPMMYKLGYQNNNCIGCVKGRAGYWNKIRKDFPHIFEKMSKVERDLGISINQKMIKGKIHRVFLDELNPNDGHSIKEPDIDCGVLCINEARDEIH